MAKVSKDGRGKTLYIEISLYPCGQADPTKNLTISCPDKDTRFKTTLSDNGLIKFREMILSFYNEHVLNSPKDSMG
jgi:hypothetical protein